MKLLYFICSTAVLIGLVCLIRVTLRRHLSPLALYMLWIPVALRLLLPIDISLAAPTGIARVLQMPYIRLERMVEHMGDDEPDAGLQQVAYNVNQQQGMDAVASGLYGDGAADAAAKAEQNKAEQAQSAGVEETDTSFVQQARDASALPGQTQAWTDALKRSLPGILAVVWLLGSVLLGSYTMVSNHRLKRCVQRSMSQCRTYSTDVLLPGCDTKLPVVVCDEAAPPCLVGVLRPCILLSSDVMENDRLLHYCVRHEVTHYRHKDHIWTFLRVLLCVVYWWNPLVWLGARLAKEDGELACDADMIAGMGAEQRKEYGLSLIWLLEHHSRTAGSVCIATAMTARGRTLRKRIRGIAQETRTKRCMLFPAALLLAVVFLAGCSAKADGSWMKYSGEENSSDNFLQHGYYTYVQSLQSSLQSRLLYYEIYQDGRMIARPELDAAKIEERDGSVALGWNLETIVSEEKEEITNLTLYIKENGVDRRGYQIGLDTFDVGGCAGTILGENEGAWQIEEDVPVPLMGLFLPPVAEPQVEPVVMRDLAGLSTQEKEEKLAGTNLVVLVYFVASEKTPLELASDYTVSDSQEKVSDEETAAFALQAQAQQMVAEAQQVAAQAQAMAQEAVQAQQAAEAQQKIADAQKAAEQMEEAQKKAQLAAEMQEIAQKEAEMQMMQMTAARETAYAALDQLYAAGGTAQLQETGETAETTYTLQEGKSAGGSKKEDRAQISERWKLVNQWVDAFTARNGKQIVALAAPQVRQQLRDSELLEGNGESISFGCSSPWPIMFADTAYGGVAGCSVSLVDETHARVRYYAWTSEPHVAVWRESLTIGDIDGTKKVIGEKLVYLDAIDSADVFESAYPWQCLLGTAMDYRVNGMGEALNENALADTNGYYKDLFEPQTAAVNLLNLDPDAVEVRSQEQRSVLSDREGEKQEVFAYVEIDFSHGTDEPDEHIMVLMTQPYGQDGIWLPAAYIRMG